MNGGTLRPFGMTRPPSGWLAGRADPSRTRRFFRAPSGGRLAARGLRRISGTGSAPTPASLLFRRGGRRGRRRRFFGPGRSAARNGLVLRDRRGSERRLPSAAWVCTARRGSRRRGRGARDRRRWWPRSILRSPVAAPRIRLVPAIVLVRTGGRRHRPASGSHSLWFSSYGCRCGGFSRLRSRLARPRGTPCLGRWRLGPRQGPRSLVGASSRRGGRAFRRPVVVLGVRRLLLHRGRSQGSGVRAGWRFRRDAW